MAGVDAWLTGLLCGPDNFKPHNLGALAYALHWYEGGMDFGNAVHWDMSAKKTGFKTFNKALETSARKP